MRCCCFCGRDAGNVLRSACINPTEAQIEAIMISVIFSIPAPSPENLWEIMGNQGMVEMQFTITYIVVFGSFLPYLL